MTRPAPPRKLRTHYLALLTPLVLTHALQSTGGLLDGFWLGRLLGMRGIATLATFFPVFFLLLSRSSAWALAPLSSRGRHGARVTWPRSGGWVRLPPWRQLPSA